MQPLLNIYRDDSKSPKIGLRGTPESLAVTVKDLQIYPFRNSSKHGGALWRQEKIPSSRVLAWHI